MDMRASASAAARESLPPEGRKPEHPRFWSWFRRAPLRALRWLFVRDVAAEHFRSPVRWLLGGDLLASLKEILLYGAFGEELDHRDWMHPEPLDLRDRANGDAPFFIDFVADMGDGQLAMYDVAALVLSELYVLPDGSVRMQKPEAPHEALPRGEVLFIGGDCAYHIANDTTLRERVIAPFAWAARERGLTRPGAADKPRLIVGVPANHDYYDSLVGFNRFLRAPGNPRTAIADYTCVQEASYVALQLPHDFWLFGLDSQNGKLDYRQQMFFRGLMQGRVPERLIVATPEPTTVHRRVMQSATHPFRDLGLPRPFIDPERPELPSAESVHLDLSGDVHHYACYQASGAPNYASVMAGGAGAFLHPSHASHAGDAPSARWPEPPVLEYPSHVHSRFALTGKLLSPVRIAGGGFLFALGALCSMLVADALPRVQAIGPLGDPDRVAIATFACVIALWALTFHWTGRSFQRATRPLLHQARRSLLDASGERKWREVITLKHYAPVALPWLVAIGALIALGRDARERAWLAQATPLLCDCALVACVLTLPVMALWVAQYTSTLPKQAKVRTLREIDYVLPSAAALGIAAAVALLGVRAYGDSRASSLVANACALLAAAMLLLVPVLLGFSQGKDRPLRVKLGYGALGAWLGTLLLLTPLYVGLHGELRFMLMSIAVALLLPLLATRVHVRNGSPWLLLALWVLTGVLVLAPGMLFTRPGAGASHLVCAMLIGGASTCIWLGWYLATALAFGAHVNEAGGAARIDAYRHFVRLKLSRDRIDGYVIGFDAPAVCTELSCPHGPGACRRLQPRLVHGFTLTPKTA